MALRFLLDEQIRRTVWTTTVRHNLLGEDLLDVVRVGSAGAPPFGTPDPDLLLWAESERRIILSEDKSTFPGHLADHLIAGHHSPGLMILRRRVYLSDLIEFLCLATYASDPREWEGRITYVP
jgi:hypothetical protein